MIKDKKCHKNLGTRIKIVLIRKFRTFTRTEHKHKHDHEQGLCIHLYHVQEERDLWGEADVCFFMIRESSPWCSSSFDDTIRKRYLERCSVTRRFSNCLNIQ